MNNLELRPSDALVLFSLLVVGSAAAGDATPLRYRESAGKLSVTVRHDITVLVDQPIEARREFDFDLSLATSADGGSIAVTIDNARASFTAHEMTQRLATRQLTGARFLLAVGDAGRSIGAGRPARTEAGDALEIDLGPMVDGGFTVDRLLIDSLPSLPPTDVVVGTEWETERPIRTLEGWTWTEGRLLARNRVTSIDRRDGHVVVTARTEATADLGSVEGGPDCEGRLERDVDWTFDATDGRLLALSLDQVVVGTTVVPQGRLKVRQRTSVELE